MISTSLARVGAPILFHSPPASRSQRAGARAAPVHRRLLLTRQKSLSAAGRGNWDDGVALRPSSVLCKSAEQEPVKAVSVVDEDGKLDAVIQVERDESPQPTWTRIYALGGGDVVFLLLFAAIGRWSHGYSFDWEAVRVADPFVAGWFVAAYLAGGYGPEGQGLKGLKMASVAAAKSWALGVPLALVLRGVSLGHIPPTPFIVVSLASTLVLQVGWRTAFTALFPNDEKSFQKKKENRKGSAFEFFGLLTSLVKRW